MVVDEDFAALEEAGVHRHGVVRKVFGDGGEHGVGVRKANRLLEAGVVEGVEEREASGAAAGGSSVTHTRTLQLSLRWPP